MQQKNTSLDDETEKQYYLRVESTELKQGQPSTSSQEHRFDTQNR